MALSRLYAYTNDSSYREKAELTLRVFAGVAEQYGMFAATYGIAAVMFSQPHTSAIVIGSGELAGRLYRAALLQFSFSNTVLKLADNEVSPQNLPPALAETLPSLPRAQSATAVICSGFTCQPPLTDPDELARRMRQAMA